MSRPGSECRAAIAALLLVPALARAQATEDLAPEPGRPEAPQTGSHLPGASASLGMPLTVITRDQLTASGTATLGELLQQLPGQGGALNGNVNNGGDGETQLSLRSLGAQHTLVLVDGRRFAPGGSGAGSSVDLGSIPAASVERVEILMDGASAIYGSDAISGVVNVITRKRVDRTEASAFAGLSQRGDAAVYDLSLVTGLSSERVAEVHRLGAAQRPVQLSAGQ